MDINRRDFLKLAGVGFGGFMLPENSPIAAHNPKTLEDSSAMLYDATLCVGCRACQLACKERAGLPPATNSEHIYEMPSELSADTWTLIKLYNGEEGFSFIKKQCMHCVEPACASVCPVQALEKTADGPVVYHGYKCIGCRYCMTACPFDIPKYEWDKVEPYIQKCDFCADRQAEGIQPSCSAACPTGALISGRRGNMLEIAHERINQKPDLYVNHVFGENEVGGTSMLYLAKVSFDKLGFPKLKNDPIPEITWPYMKSVPYVFFGMGALMTGIYYLTHREKKTKEE